MQKKYTFADGKTIQASSPEEFVIKMRRGSWHPGKSVKQYMTQVAERGRKLGLQIDDSTENNFVESLKQIGYLFEEQTNTIWN